LCILIASIFAALILYYLSAGGWALPTAHSPQVASVDPTPAVAPSLSKKEHQLIKAQDDDPGRLAQAKTERTKTSRTARLLESETVAMLQPAETGIQPPPSNKTIRALDPEEIKLLTKQGEQFAEAGDLVTSRILFQRAADAGDATAATALGATYDPFVLAKLGVVGISADVEKARFWYQKAASLGSSDAKRRLELLANR
jgi:Sel1 repeat